jgi:hypothetical protein
MHYSITTNCSLHLFLNMPSMSRRYGTKRNSSTTTCFRCDCFFDRPETGRHSNLVLSPEVPRTRNHRTELRDSDNIQYAHRIIEINRRTCKSSTVAARTSSVPNTRDGCLTSGFATQHRFFPPDPRTERNEFDASRAS